MTQLLVPILAGGAATLCAYVVLDIFFGEQRRIRRRLQALGDYESRAVTEVEPQLLPFSQRVIEPAAHALGRALRSLAPQRYFERLRARLDAAGMASVEPESVFALKVLPAGAVCTVALVVSLARGGAQPGGVLATAAAAAVGFALPDLIVAQRRTARMKTIRQALPDFLDMLTISVEAGLGFDAALAKLVQNSSGPLAEEFARMLAEIQAGLPRSEAFRRMSTRCSVPEVATFANSIMQADVFGVSVAGVLRTQASELRIKRRQRAEEQAQKSPVKMVFPLVLCILPVTIIVILGPAVIAIARAFGLGW